MENYDGIWNTMDLFQCFTVFAISEILSFSQTRKIVLATTTNPICSMYGIFTHV